ncbi:MAG: DpnD/PcfM family protein [Ruminococcus sp.]|nr:DpnD/PcfM family protein [Ruminococcus sp.]
MKKITDGDLEKIIGSSVYGFRIEKARRKNSDSDFYGIALGKNDRNVYVTWQFHFDGDEISAYWGHYTEKYETALRDFYSRDFSERPNTYKVTITEISKMNVFARACSREEAEQIVSDKWRNSEYVLDSESFCNAEFTAVETDEEGYDES